METQELQSIFARAVECLDRKINSEEAYIDSVKSIDWDQWDSSGNLIDLELKIKVNSDSLLEPTPSAA